MKPVNFLIPCWFAGSQSPTGIVPTIFHYCLYSLAQMSAKTKQIKQTESIHSPQIDITWKCKGLLNHWKVIFSFLLEWICLYLQYQASKTEQHVKIEYVVQLVPPLTNYNLGRFGFPSLRFSFTKVNSDRQY